jgi:hypothetical protein
MQVIWLSSRSQYDNSVYEAGDHVTTQNFNNDLPTAAVFLDIEKAFDTTGHSGLLYKLSELEFSRSLIKLIAGRKFEVLIEGEFSTPRKITAGVP